MIALVVGTTAELIKVAPVVHELTRRGSRPLLWFTGQHVDAVPSTLRDLDLQPPDRWLVREDGARGLERPAQVPGWAADLLRTVWRERRALRAELTSDGRPPLVMVHGDTFTAPLGALVGRRLGARVAHVEAGMRSGSLLSPLPEEANRRLAARVVDLHFAPTRREVDNLRGARGVVVETGANTVVDAVRFALERHAGGTTDLPARYGVVTLHRFELVSREDRYRAVLEALRAHAEQLPLLYLAGGSERERLGRYGLLRLFDERLVLRPKLSYLRFLPVLAGAELVVTDSGGLQEECAYLGLPCAIHRDRTEQHRGLGENIVLTGLDDGVLARFLTDAAHHRRPSVLDAHHPSRTIADTLARLGLSA